MTRQVKTYNPNHIFVDTNVLIGAYSGDARFQTDSDCLHYLYSIVGKRLYASTLSVAQLISVYQKKKTNDEIRSIVRELQHRFTIMTHVAGRMVLTFFFCCAMTTVVNAQTAETESSMDKYLRLSKEADENPTNWQAQLEVGHILLDKESGVYNQSRAARYYERIYQQAAGFNKEVPDSVFLESVVTLMTVASEKKDVNKLLFYIDELMRAEKAGMDIGKDYVLSYGCMGVLFNLMNGDAAKALWHMLDMRKLADADKKPGIEYSDPMTVMLYENLLSGYRKTFGDKLPEFTLGGKKYIVIAMNHWNVEMPLMGWLGSLDGDGNDERGKEPKLFYGEDGKVYDDMHGEMNYSFNFNKDGFVPQEGYNVRMITVTPEERQKMVDAYHSYMKKHKKDAKK